MESTLTYIGTNLQVFSWEPIRCHDGVDVGWSKLSDLNVHEGKLLGCSYNQSCVGVWVVDITVFFMFFFLLALLFFFPYNPFLP